jgi:hypothetical protein
MLSRNENGKLKFKSLDFEIFIGDLYAECNTEKEIEWLQEQLQPIIEGLAEERLEEI